MPHLIKFFETQLFFLFTIKYKLLILVRKQMLNSAFEAQVCIYRALLWTIYYPNFCPFFKMLLFFLLHIENMHPKKLFFHDGQIMADFIYFGVMIIERTIYYPKLAQLLIFDLFFWCRTIFYPILPQFSKNEQALTNT